APPAYGELHNQLNLSQAGFNANASITDDGRIRININQTDGTLADLLAPALIRSQALPSEKSSEPLPPAYIPPSLGGRPGQEPPPKLNVVIQIVGSRGDVQPFVALGKVLKDTYGHRVRVATHPVFRTFVEENGLEFFSIGGDPAELMAFMVKHPGLMPGFDAVKSGEIAKRRRGIEQIVLGCWRSCVEAGDGLGPPPEPHQSGEPLSSFTNGDYTLPGDTGSKPFVADAIIANPPSFAHIHIAEKMGIPLHMMFTMPWTATKAFPHPLANIESSNAEVVMTNCVSYAMVEMMTWQGLGDVINRFRTKVLDLEPLSLIWAPGLLTRLQIPTTYCWSPALIPKPTDWGREISISGFYFLDLATSYTPAPDLAAFLDAGPPPIYIGFGSIVVDDPNKLTRMIFDAVTIAGVRALVSQGWGGLGADSVGIPDGVFMLGNCPHDWLFKKVSCVVHHGGAGTTAAGIKTGTPTVVVPFFGDQPFWGSMIAQAGAGPKPVRYKDLTAEILAEMITSALQPETQARAKELGERIRAEKGADVGAKSFHDFLDYDKLRCSVAPSRIAVWRVRRTQVRLSGLAAAVLVKEGLLQYTDLKLYRPNEYSTEQQPWDPITAVTSALVGDVGTMALAIQDIPGPWMKMAKKSQSGTPPPTTTSGGGKSEEAATSSTSHDGASTTTLTQTTDVSSQLLTPSTSGRDGSSTPEILQPSTSATGSSNSRSGSKPLPRQKSNFDVEGALDASIETGKGVQRLVETGMKTPMNFCLGLAKGFRNAPRLYNDDTVRKQEKVTGLASGVMVAGKEFGLGLFDGITGLVTQPLRGAEKDGAKGLISGFGKGIGGIVFKPAAGVWAVPAYLMKGVHAEFRAKFHKSVENYIIVSRILQGQDDQRHANPQEQNDIVLRFNSLKDEMKGFQLLKSKGKQAASSSAPTQAQDRDSHREDNDSTVPDAPPKTGFLATRHLPIEERRRLHALKDAWKKNKDKADASSSSSVAPPPAGSPESEDEEIERAIRESIAQTSRGDHAEDLAVESQMRASLREMKRIAGGKQGQGGQEKGAATGQQPPAFPERVAQKAAEAGMNEDISEEEFQALIAEAVRQSVTAEQQRGTAGDNGDVEDEEDEEFRRALEESRRGNSAGVGHGGGDDDEELKRAVEESERAHREHLARNSTERSEEEIVMEYVKKQSLAEEALRQKAARGKDNAAATSRGGEDEDDDEDLKRAMEESLRMSGRTGGPSG
ncbi:family 1 glycosyltransferase, partial [Cryphonectria parasitica EP155]